MTFRPIPVESPSVPHEATSMRESLRINPFSVLLDTLARPRCIECERSLSGGGGALCIPCDLRLPRWRRADGCPRCGTSIALPRSNESERVAGMFEEDAGEGCPGCFAEGSALHLCRSLSRYVGSLRRWIPGFKSARSPFGPSIPIRRAIDPEAIHSTPPANSRARIIGHFA